MATPHVQIINFAYIIAKYYIHGRPIVWTAISHYCSSQLQQNTQGWRWISSGVRTWGSWHGGWRATVVVGTWGGRPHPRLRWMDTGECNDLANLCDGVVCIIRWRCPKKACRKKKSIRHGSWFSHHHLTLEQVLTITFLWSANLEPHIITSWAHVNAHTKLITYAK